VAGAVAVVALPRAGQPPLELLIASVALAVGGLIATPTTPANRYTIAVAVASAMPFVFRSGTRVDLVAVVGVYGAGLAATWFLRLARGEDLLQVFPNLLRRLVSFGAYAAAFTALLRIPAVEALDEWRDIPPVIAGICALIGIEVAAGSLQGGWGERSPKYLALATMKDLNALVALAVTGALFGLAYPTIGWWALAVAGLPYVFAHSGFRRLHDTKRTYRQTIRALARIPEVAGLGSEGHADRTTALALEIAKEVGLPPAVVEDLEFAALMHDIGRITLTDPAIVQAGYTDADIAKWGAEIIAQAPYLDRVAEHVRRLNDPFRQPGEQVDPTMSMISKIIRAASAYDHAIQEQGFTSLQAVEELHRGAAYDYDPEVVASLRKVLERRGAFHPAARHQ
jgi:hypothetical protein